VNEEVGRDQRVKELDAGKEETAAVGCWRKGGRKGGTCDMSAGTK